MAYLASNRPTVPVQIFTKAPAALVVGTTTTVGVGVYTVGNPVWVSIRPTRLTARALDGTGRIRIATEGCPANRACDRRPLYVLTGTPIPHQPAGGVLATSKLGIALRVDAGAVQPGRYELALPIRYPSNAANAAVLDVSDTLRVRIDVYSTPPPSPRCTAADLRRPSAVIPAPHVLTDTISIEGGSTRLDPPPRGFRPRISAARARRSLSAELAPGGGGVDTFVLASVSELYPRSPSGGGSLLPDTHDVVAWVLYHQRFAGTPPVGPPGGRDTRVTQPPAPCVFYDGIAAINATNGADLDSSGGSAAADLIHF